MQHATWSEFPRFVSRRRAAKLRKRGVDVYRCAVNPRTNRVCYVWYESVDSVRQRELLRTLRKAGRFPIWYNDAGLARVREAWAEICKRTNFAEVEARVAALIYGIDTATGAALDALCSIPFRPPGMTDDEVRELYTKGYVLKSSPIGSLAELQDEANKQRVSPQLQLYALGYETDKPFESISAELREIEGHE